MGNATLNPGEVLGGFRDGDRYIAYSTWVIYALSVLPCIHILIKAMIPGLPKGCTFPDIVTEVDCQEPLRHRFFFGGYGSGRLTGNCRDEPSIDHLAARGNRTYKRAHVRLRRRAFAAAPLPSRLPPFPLLRAPSHTLPASLAHLQTSSSLRSRPIFACRLAASRSSTLRQAAGQRWPTRPGSCSHASPCRFSSASRSLLGCCVLASSA